MVLSMFQDASRFENCDVRRDQGRSTPALLGKSVDGAIATAALRSQGVDFTFQRSSKNFNDPRLKCSSIFAALTSKVQYVQLRLVQARAVGLMYLHCTFMQFMSICTAIEVIVKCASATVLLRLVKALATTQCKARRPGAQLHLGLLSDCEM